MRFQRPYAGWAILVTILVLIGALMPGAEKQFLLSPFPEAWHVDKWGHFTGFGLMAYFFHRCWGSSRRVFAFALALALLTEFLQLYIPGRTSKLADVAIDCCGALVGILVASAWKLRSQADAA